MSVPKEYKMINKKEIPNQKISTLDRFQNKIFTTCQISNQVFYNASDFETKLYNVSDFVLKSFLKIRLCTKLGIQKITFSLNLPRKMDEFCNFERF